MFDEVFFGPGADLGPAPDLEKMDPQEFNAALERHRTCGVSAEQLRNAGAEMSSAGLVRLQQVVRARELQNKREQKNDPDAQSEKLYAAEREQLGHEQALERFLERAKEEEFQQRVRDGVVPVWQQLSGLRPEYEGGQNPNRRAYNIACLIRAVEKIVRFELRHAAKQRAGVTARFSSADGETGGRGDGGTPESHGLSNPPVSRSPRPPVELPGSRLNWRLQLDAAADDTAPHPLALTRVYHWDPLRAVCFQLEISLSRLSLYCKELTGLSASELVEHIRAESVGQKMRGELKAWLLDFYGSLRNSNGNAQPPSRGASRVRRSPRPLGERADVSGSERGVRGNAVEPGIANATNPQSDWTADELYAALQRSRRLPRFHRTTWAAEFGFASYQKFFRGCLHCHGATPHQLEIEILDALLALAEIIEAAAAVECAVPKENDTDAETPVRQNARGPAE